MKPAPISVDAPPAANETAELTAGDAGSYLRQPTQIGPYKILRIIGRGGMGTVYRAQVVVSCEVPIGQEVAIKLLRETNDKERKRFVREAAYLQVLRHPGIVRVLDSGEYHDQPYIVMQLVEGHHADDLLAPGKPLDQQQVADLAIQALDALQAAHLHSILHRDIKPGNLMITPTGQLKLVDFGLAQYMDAAESHLTATGAVVGTPAYMSPEQASGRREEIGRRSDIYSMGACLYELLTGQQPFTADNSVALLRRIIEEPLVPPGRLRPDLSRDLETVVLKAMAKDWRDRYASAEAMAADLRRFRLGVRVRTGRPGVLRPLLRAAWQQRSTLALIGLVLFVAMSLATLLVLHGLKRRDAADASALAIRAGETTGPGGPAGLGDATSAAPGDRQPPAPAASVWVETFRQDLALDDSKSEVRLKDGSPIGKGMKLAILPAVSGPVRLAATIELLDVVFQVDLLVSDSDLGKGYRLRLEGGKTNDRLLLMRKDKVVRSRDLGQLVRGQPLRLQIERDEEVITARLANREPLPFSDLIPLTGLDADAVYIAFTPGQVRIGEVKLDRQRTNLYVSALSKADSFRQQGKLMRAKDEYENFLADHPGSPEARDALLRIGLCLEGMATPATDEQALARFNEVAAAYRDEPRYVLAATFHAWGCALRLGNYQAAEEYFEAIRRDYDLTTLLVTVPEAMVQELVKDYLTRADQVAGTEPERAVRLYITGADFASYLNQRHAAAEAQNRAGDVLMSLGRSPEALERYRGVANDMTLPPKLRVMALLKVAEAERLRDHLDASAIAYQMILSQPKVDDFAAWARLWLGDIYAQRGDLAEAQACWGKSGETQTLPGRIMYHLLTANRPMTLGDDRYHANDIEYFNARLALMRGHIDGYLAHLDHVVQMGPANDWPAPFALHLRQLMITPPPAVPDPDAVADPDAPEK
jgi:tetratricopeptide (TPR) repeat protein